MTKTAIDLLREIYDDVVQGALPNASDAWFESARAALAAPAQAAPPASVEQEAMQMLWNDQQQEEKEHYRNVARGAELPLYAIHHPEDIDKTKRRAVPEQPAAPAKAVLADPAAQAAPEDASTRFKAQHEFLIWNREQTPPPIESATEYSVFNQAVDFYIAARAAQEGK